jgi:hypothetical protein
MAININYYSNTITSTTTTKAFVSSGGNGGNGYVPVVAW